MDRRQGVFAFLMLVVLLFGSAVLQAQVNTAALSGTVTDPQGLPVKAAKVTASYLATGVERTTVTDDNGHYNLVSLTPGAYKVTVDGGGNFALLTNLSLSLTVGQAATLDLRLGLRGMQQTVLVTSEAAAIETTKTEVSQTVEQRRIDNLPINGRNYINFTLTNSQTTRDVSPTIGPAPNSGLNVSGSRARSNMVSVDGADAVDNSINGIRSTVSQEGVQEFQLILSNYNAEYGRATGGVVNIVTKSGGNEFHGNVFSYLRNKSFQARNPFSGQIDPSSGQLLPTKQAYTRTQSGLTFGGPLRKDKTFYFFSYEYTQREETGFSSIGIGNFGVSPLNCGAGCPLNGLLLTSDQATAVTKLLQAGQSSLASQYAALMGSASSVALQRIDPGLICGGAGLCAGPGARFSVPVGCPANATVGTVHCTPFGVGLASLPNSFVGLNSLRGNFPIMEKTSLWSARIDHNWSSSNHSFLRVGVSPSLVTGIEATSQNQVFGQNAASRTGLNQSRDLNFTFQHDTIVSNNSVNQFRAQIARRGLHFGFSQSPGGDQIAVNIPGFAYFGREPYSPVNRIERRFEFTDNVTMARGSHTFKFGGDVNVIQLRSKKQQIFELDFGGLANFGGFAASTFKFPDCFNTTTGPHNGACAQGEIALAGTTGLQSYGLGIPTSYIQGIGSSNQPFENLPFAFFAQDTWRMNRHFTLNYGVRYDVEISPLFAPATAVNAAAEKALGVQEGIRRDYNNVAPRVGLAWDPSGKAKTVFRASYGLFYDHPLLATAFDSVTADGGRSVQLISTGGTASACGLIPQVTVCGSGKDTPANLNGSSIFQGVLNAFPSMFYLPNEQRFDALAPNSLFANQNYLTAGFPLPILPFTLPLSTNFVYAYAHQANLTVEREIAGSWRLSVGYQWTRGLHLNRPVDINSTDPKLLDQNAFNAGAAGISVSNPLTVVAPSSTKTPTASTCGVGVVAAGALGQLFGCPAPVASLNGKFVATPAFFNFFRPSGPNPSFASLVPGGYGTQVQLAGLAGYPTGFGVPVAFNSVDAQLSDGNSWYNALTVNLSKRFSSGFELLSSYTWSHSIDDSTDLQSPLEPQDSRFPFLERSNSVNDQRHRWVTSAVFQSAAAKSGDSAWKYLIGDFTVAPIVEVSSGRPFNVITGEDTRLDLGASQARPSVGGATSSPFIPGVTFGIANQCIANDGTPFTVPGITSLGAGCTGNLGRNRFFSPGFFQWDLRVSRRIPFGEKLKLDLIVDAFNLFNRTNIASVNQVCDPSAGATCSAGQPTASYDARQFQFALKLSW